MIEPGKIKQLVLQEIIRHSVKDEWIHGRSLDAMLGIEERVRKQIIADLIQEGNIIIASKSKGYKIAKDEQEVDVYCETRKRELITSFRQLKILKARSRGDSPLFLQDQVIDFETEREIQALKI